MFQTQHSKGAILESIKGMSEVLRSEASDADLVRVIRDLQRLSAPDNLPTLLKAMISLMEETLRVSHDADKAIADSFANGTTCSDLLASTATVIGGPEALEAKNRESHRTCRTEQFVVVQNQTNLCTGLPTAWMEFSIEGAGCSLGPTQRKDHLTTFTNVNLTAFEGQINLMEQYLKKSRVCNVAKNQSNEKGKECDRLQVDFEAAACALAVAKIAHCDDFDKCVAANKKSAESACAGVADRDASRQLSCKQSYELVCAVEKTFKVMDDIGSKRSNVTTVQLQEAISECRKLKHESCAVYYNISCKQSTVPTTPCQRPVKQGWKDREYQGTFNQAGNVQPANTNILSCLQYQPKYFTSKERVCPSGSTRAQLPECKSIIGQVFEGKMINTFHRESCEPWSYPGTGCLVYQQNSVFSTSAGCSTTFEAARSNYPIDMVALCESSNVW